MILHIVHVMHIYIEFLVEPIMHIYIINVSQTTILINSHIHTCIAIYNFSYICMLPSEHDDNWKWFMTWSMGAVAGNSILPSDL